MLYHRTRAGVDDMADSEKEERTVFVKLYSTSIDGVDANKLSIGDLDKFIGRKLETVEATGTEICLVFEPSTPDTGEKE